MPNSSRPRLARTRSRAPHLDTYWTPRPMLTHSSSSSSSTLPLSMAQEDAVVIQNGNVSVPRNLLRTTRFQPLSTKLFSSQATSGSAANTALSVAINISFAAATFPEIATFEALYDEVRVKAITIHFMFYTALYATAAQQNGAGVCSLTWDSAGALPTSLGNILTNPINSGLREIQAQAGCPPVPVYPGGRLQTLHSRTPNGVDVISSTECPGNAWFSLIAASNPTVGVINAYIPAIGTTGVTGFWYLIELDVDFRLRL